MSEVLTDSKHISITLPNGEVRQYPDGSTGLDIAASIGKRLAEDAVCVKHNGSLLDLTAPIHSDGDLQILTFDSDEGREVYWHSSSHLMAQAIEELFPESKFGAGPAIENGFYYDISSPHRFTDEDLEKIETRMIEIGKRQIPIQREVLPRQEAISYFQDKRQDPFKVEILEDTLSDQPVVSIYHQGDFSDLCSGPHFPNTSKLKAVKLTGVSGSFWRGDANRQQMQRIYGISFPSEKMLKKHFRQQEEAKKRDHRKLGAELELFLLSPKVGSGLPLWLPNGAILRDELVTFLKAEQQRRGYLPVVTPHIGNIELYKTSGHYPYYSDSQFPPLSFQDELGVEEQFLLKPMNCPHHHQIYMSKPRSYRDLPIRLTEFGTVYRYEQSGELNGLIRVRGFTQDDSHIYCRPDQLIDEICNAIDLTQYVFKTLGFSEVKTRLSLRDPENSDKYSGSDEQWDQAEQDVVEAAKRMDLNYDVGLGEASFYGPKIDFIVKDAIGRKWQLGTVQVDYVMPERFDLTYTGSDGQKHRPVVIHRAPFGSLERFIGILIENFAGNFPVWLSPVQGIVLPINESLNDYAREIQQSFIDANLRVDIDFRAEKIGKKIRDAEVKKIPYMFVIGEKEKSANMVALRRHTKGDLGAKPLSEVIEQLKQDVAEKSL
jgi:threonyl-tRNA synthetase